MLKMVVSDLDGTLINGDDKLPGRVKGSLRREGR